MGMDLTSTVLVVDDDLAIRRALKELLTAEGYDVACASNGLEALAKAAQLTPDLILLDVVMPEMDGLTVCQRLRADPLLAEVPIIMVTSLADRTSRLRGFEAGADDYVSKPIDTPELLARVRTTTRLNRYRRLLLEQAHRQQAETALRESEERFRSVVEQSNDGIVLTDEQGAIIEWNRGAERIFGLQRDEALGQPLWDVQFQAMPKERRTTASHERLKAGILEFLRTRQAPWLDQFLEMEIQRPDGRHRIVQTVSFCIKMDQGFMLGSISRDITERKQAEEALHRERDRAQMYLDVAGAIMLVLNEIGEIVLINRRGCQILGCEEKTLIGRNWFDTYLPTPIREETKSVFEQLMAGKVKAVEYFENPVLTGAGEERIIAWHNTALRDEAGRITGTLSSGMDITERKHAEEALQDSERRYRLLIENTPTVTWVTGQDGKTTYISANVEKVYGYSPDEILEAGQALWFGRIHPEDRDRVRQEFESLFSKQKHFDVEYRIQRKDRNWIWVRDRANIVEEKEENPYAYGVFSDITGRKHAEEALQRYAERLEILHEIDQGILAAQSPEAIGQATVTRIRQLIPCQRATVTVFDPAINETVILAVDADYETEVKEGTRVPTESLGNNITALEKGQIVTWEVLPSQGGMFERLYAEGVRSYATIPLITQGELIGSLNLALTDLGQFTEEHRDITRQLADQLAIAIQQASLHDQVERHAEELEQRVADRTRELSVLYAVAALANRSLDLETTLARSLEAALEAVDSNAGTIHLLDETDEMSVEKRSVDGFSEGGMLRLAVQQGISSDVAAQLESLPSGEGLGKWLVEHSEPLIIPDITSDPRLNVTLPIEPHAYVGIPLQAAGRTSAVLSVVRRMDQPQFKVEELSLLTSVADQLGIVVESARLRKQAERAAALEERERLARDLHDSVTQLLYSVNLFARSARNAHKLGDVDELDRCLTEVGEAGQQALKEMRLMVYELRPRALEQEGLIGAIQHRLDAVEGRVGVATQLLVDEMFELPQRMEQDLYHITVEALNNALKYAKATSVTVSLAADRERVRLEVTDDGAGFDPRAVEDRGGLGLVGMRERAERLGGALQVISAPGEGTSVRVELVETHRDSQTEVSDERKRTDPCPHRR